MKSLRLLLFLFALPLFDFAQTPDLGPLTNQRVILLVQSGVRTSEVVRVIGNAPTVSFNLTPSDMDQLLRAGVSDDTIKLMAARELGLDPTENTRIASDNAGNPRYSQFPQSIASGRLRNAVFFPDQGGGGGGGSGTRQALIVPEHTLVRLRLTRNVSSDHTRMDDIIHFEVLQDVTVRNTIGNFVVIERGATAWGTVTDADQKRRMGRAGKVEVTIDFVKLANGDKIALTAASPSPQRNGQSHVGLMVGLMVPTAFVSFPATPFWLFMHGKDTTVKDGFDTTAFTDGVADLDSLDFRPR